MCASALYKPSFKPHRKTISVNDPLRFRGVTVYQTDWDIAAIDLRVTTLPTAPSLADRAPAPSTLVGADTGRAVRLPLAEVQNKLKVNGKTWATFLPLEGPSQAGGTPRGITLLAQDFQSVVVYDAKGAFAGVRRPGSNNPIVVEGVSIVVDDLVGSSGLQLKHDPGVPLVYAGFGGLMLTTVVSALSHSQVQIEEGRRFENQHIRNKTYTTLYDVDSHTGSGCFQHFWLGTKIH